jgi:excisionase family DNA binding protein
MVSNTFLTPAEVGKILKVTPQTVRAMCERGELDHVRIGTGKRTTYRIQQRFLDRLMQKSDWANVATEAEPVGDADLMKTDDDEYIRNWFKKK